MCSLAVACCHYVTDVVDEGGGVVDRRINAMLCNPVFRSHEKGDFFHRVVFSTRNSGTQCCLQALAGHLGGRIR